jgi:hypothetical protein
VGAGAGVPVRVIATGEVGTQLPLLGDAHVHLGLTDPTLLLAGGIGRVQELGWVPDIAAGWRSAALDSAALGTHAYPEISIAGAFLAAPGGYPSGREWAPAGAVREVLPFGEAGASDAQAAVAEQRAVGASVIKVTLNSTAGPVHDDATLHAIVAAAHATGLYVVAHVEGVGQAARAIAARIDVLAHTPFSERLDDLLLEQASAQSQAWISTLDIHGYGEPDAQQTASLAIATDNLRRFLALGGDVIYGTDLGNGKLPVGVNAREVRALLGVGMSVDDVIVAMTTWWGAADVATQRVTFVPGSYVPGADSGGADPGGVDSGNTQDFADWLARARVLKATELETT